VSHFRWNLLRGTALRGTALICSALVMAAATGCSFGSASVDRVDNGQAWRGRYIPAGGYAWYARGAHLEARGQLEDAEEAFLQAVRHDPESGSTWARIGAIRCLRSDGDSEQAFRKGWETRHDRMIVLLERGKCSLLSGHPEKALRDGQAATRRLPRSIDANLLVIDSLTALGRQEEALRWLDALAAFAPGAHRVQSRRLAEARARGDIAREQRAREVRNALLRAQTLEAPIEDPELAARGKAAVDAALLSEQFDLALQRATIIGMHKSELALRAVALGRPELARRIAALVLEADPADANGRLALVLANDVSPPSALPEPQFHLTSDAPLHPIAILLFGEMLDRKVGGEAGHLWRNAQAVPASEDPLVERLRGRPTAGDSWAEREHSRP
jgi:tetratricopeptide (TPR) repeat protein